MQRQETSTMDAGEEVVISGISGRFPQCNNMKELKENLMAKIDLISEECRWESAHAEIPHRMGKVNNLHKFDATFFGVHGKLAEAMDPMARTLLEHTYEAILDAGVNPVTLRGKNVAVIVGTSFSESEKTWIFERIESGGTGVSGCSRAMFSNRLSYYFGFHGPSYTIDTACSSSLYALDQACKLILRGECDGAVVAGANICLHPHLTLQFSRLGVLAKDGRCRTFDESACGYVRSEAIASIFLQRSKDAKRIYGTVVHTKTNSDGYKEEGISFPSTVFQRKLLQAFYEECNIPPQAVRYLECHGTATSVGDPEEIHSVQAVYNPTPATPLMIGSVKSNIGHSEPASGVCSIAKIIIAMETGVIPPNINFKKPKAIAGLADGSLRVVSEPTPWKVGYTAVNSFGFGGTNSHALLRPNPKEKVNGGTPTDPLPRLIVVSGRTEEAVDVLLKESEQRPLDVEHVGLLHNIFATNISAHLYRGYTVLSPGTVLDGAIARGVSACNNTDRPVCFCFTGMGSQWHGMGEVLLGFPIFADAMRKCDAVLKPRGVDIFEVITSKDPNLFNNVMRSFIGITAIQIGLVDLLTAVGITPDIIIGHSLGEMACAYADGCFTTEQTILAAYSRGLTSNEVELIPGAMAAVGIGYEEIKDICPPDIDVACHNSSTSSTISGPVESIKKFVAELQEKKIFAREVASSNIAYHSRYIREAGPKLLSHLVPVIPNPKPRSEKWLSTSVPQSKWSTLEAKLCSAEYHTNNLLNPVLFEETTKLIPNNAIIIEIAPHGLLQAILKRSFPPTVTNVSLTLRSHPDSVQFFLEALGKLYTSGVQLQLANLYPPVQFPVSRGTPMISPYIRWDHSNDLFVATFNSTSKMSSVERLIDVNVEDEQFEYMLGHVIDQRILLPATSYLYLVWQTFSMMKGQPQMQLSVVFEDVRFERATTLQKTSVVKLTIVIQIASGRFEITEGQTLVVSGVIRDTTNMAREGVARQHLPEITEEEPITADAFYKDLRLRGYSYSGLFRGVRSCSITGRKAHAAWQDNWASFMDTMLQVQLMCTSSRQLMVPTSIRKLVINAPQHTTMIEDLMEQSGKDDVTFPVYIYEGINVILSGGIEIHGLRVDQIMRRKQLASPVIDEYTFVPYRDRATLSLSDMVKICTDIVCERELTSTLKLLEAVEDDCDLPMSQLLTPVFIEKVNDVPLATLTAMIVTASHRYEADDLPPNVTIVDPSNLPTSGTVHVAVGYNLLATRKLKSLLRILNALKDSGFILLRECKVDDQAFDIVGKLGLVVVMEKRTDKELLLLMRKRGQSQGNTEVIYVRNDEFDWIEKVKTCMAEDAHDNKNAEAMEAPKCGKVLLVSEEFESGVLGFANCAMKEPGGHRIRVVLIMDKGAPKFSMNDPFYAKQLQLDLPVNVFREGAWGCYRHLQLPPPVQRHFPHVFAYQKTRGDLSSLKWTQGPIDEDHDRVNLVKVAYSSLNFKDVMVSTGRLSLSTIARRSERYESILGLEYSGVDSKGRRVMGMLSDGAISNVIIANPVLQFEVPKEWSLEDAATVPVVYLTCIEALYARGNMKKGDKVLIHSGTGGVGQAAINLALAEGCEVFTTVGTPEKRKFIRETFPSIDDDHIGNSRDTSFEEMVMRVTEGRGVDIVLNSLAEEKLQASVRCLARCGRFLEIGKYDIGINSQLGMYAFNYEIGFHGIMLDFMMYNNERAKELSRLFLDRCRRNIVKPIVRKVFPSTMLEEAFRYMAAGKHIGKVLIKVPNGDENIGKPLPGYPRYYCKPNRTYVLIGGLGGFGLELADWLYERGAQNIVLVSRNGITNNYQLLRVKKLKLWGVNVEVLKGLDASKRTDCEEILSAARQIAPVDAIFNLAVNLKDALLVNQTIETFEASVKPKAWITKRLDELSRKFCPKLRHFVIFSSVSCGRGNPGQTNYGFGNSVMERICERRRREGLPGLAIQWGAVGDVGIVADKLQTDEEISVAGTLLQKIHSCLEELDRFLCQERPVVSSMVVAEKARGTGADSAVDFILDIMSIKSLKNINQNTPLAELGLDSMMAVEIKQTLERDFDIFYTQQEIRNLSFSKLLALSSENQSSSDTSKPVQMETNAEINMEINHKCQTSITTMAECQQNSR